MGNKREAEIQEETGFTSSQIERLYSPFAREDFLRILELTINPLSERIVHSLLAESHDDIVEFLQFRERERELAHFRPIRKYRENKLNKREEKL